MYFLADCGPIGPDFLPAHGHGDVLSFEWDVEGLRIVVDPGVCEYHEGQSRAYSRATASHNTLTLDNADQCEFWKSFRVGRRVRVLHCRCQFTNGHILLEGVHDGYSHMPGQPLHRRVVESDASYVSVRDFVEGGNGQKAIARLLLHPDCSVRRIGSTIQISRDRVMLILDTDCPVEEEQAWWMPDFGVKQAATRLAIQYGRAPCSGSFALSKADRID
jgi:uncharacterized heparinase superfamily protein